MISGLSLPIWSTTLAGVAIFLAVVWTGRRAFLHGGMYGPFDSRLRKRVRVRGSATLYLTASGRRYLVHARVGDISEHGAGIVSPVAITPPAQVLVELPELHLAGTGTVRQCSQHGSSYRIGIQFAEALSKAEDAETAGAVRQPRRGTL